MKGLARVSTPSLDSSPCRRRKRARVALAVLAILGLLAVQARDTDAQQSSPEQLLNMAPDQLKQMLGGRGSSGSSTLGQGVQSQFTILEPTAQSNPHLSQSRLEQILSARAGVALTQFGYDQLGIGRSVNLPEVGAVQDDYILGPGDEIVVTLRGQDNSEYHVTVDRDGNVVLPKISPIAATGRKLGDLRAQLQASVHSAYTATEAYVTVGRLRQVSVTVAGEVWSPGVRILTGLSTPVDALMVSGGIKKTGSLRKVQLIHQGHSSTIDLYSLLTGSGIARQFTLGDGDRIVVPPLTKVVAVAGWVRRAGIYEIPAGQTGISVQALTALAGGLEVRGHYRLAALRVEDSGQTQLVSITSQSSPIRDGEILLALPGADQVVDRATLAGGTALSGSYSIKDGTRLSDILKAPGALGQSPYTIFGVISRRDPRTYLRSLIAYSPVAALAGDDDPSLKSDDIVRVFSMKESRLLSRSITEFAAKKEFSEELARDPYATAPSGALSPTNEGTSGNSSSNGSPSGNPMPGSSNSGATMSDEYVSGESMAGDSLTGQPFQGQTISGQNPAGQNFAGQNFSGPSQSGNAGTDDLMSGDQSSPIWNCDNTQSMETADAYSGQYQQQDSQDIGNSQYPAAMVPGAMAPGTMQGGGLYPQYPQLGNYQGRQPNFTGYGGRIPCGKRKSPAANFEQEVPTPGTVATNTEVTTLTQLAGQLGVDKIVLLNFLSDHEVTLDGAIRGPGAYVVGPDINLHDLVMVAGGTVQWADKSGVELISTAVNQSTGSATTIRKNLPLNPVTLANYIIQPHDEFRFRQVFTNITLEPVMLEGEVRFPGQYKIVRGEHLLDLLKRAGGLTDVAYPFGTVYLRRSVAALEQQSFRKLGADVENQLVGAMARPDSSTRIDATTFAAVQGFIKTLRTQKGLGRISVTADPSILAARPEQNPLLEAGDVIYIPQRPGTVSVLGEVMQPGSYLYRSNMTAGDYLTKAGGFSGFADDSLTYIILPDGSAEQLDKSWLPLGSRSLPPGSVIVVPREIAPLNLREVLLDSTQVFSQLAVAVASLAVLATYHN
jgi:polysaccharide export outer membrane protein